MLRILLLILLTIYSGSHCLADELPSDSTTHKRKRPQFIAVDAMGGFVLPTNDYIKAGNGVPTYGSLSLKYGVKSTGDRWEDVAYGMPYYGIGFYTAHFFNKKALGSPFSLFLFQGAEFKRYNPRLSLNYELNLGMSFNWKSYDAFDNPENIALGSSVNVHVGANLYLKRRLSNVWDLNVGIGLTHFSNGAQQLPNKGINLAAPFIELVYNINSDPIHPGKKALVPPPHEKRIDYDIIFTTTTRQIRLDTVGTGLPSRLIDKNFKVFGLSYATLFVPNYKYKWGPSLEVVYDESSDIKAWRQLHPEDGQYYDRVKLGPLHKRFTIGLSLKGEMTFPYVSFFANLGYNILHGNDYDYRFYQILGAKAYLSDNIFGTFGIRSSRFSKAQYLYWSIGYTIKGKSLNKKDKYIHHILP